MPRPLHSTRPVIINSIISKHTSKENILEIQTGNKNKLKEFERVLKDYEIIAKDFDIDEIQSLDPVKVASKKAIAAWEANHFNPILVEDTSLQMLGLDGKPGTYINDFGSSLEMRKMIAESWLKDKDRRAVAQVTLAIYDGVEVHIREGKVEGTISETLKGTNGFGWDDIFIPKGSSKTFAEMTEKEKDKFSMRKIAIEKLKKEPFKFNIGIWQIPEPYEQELKRMRIKPLQDKTAMKFAYALEPLEGENKPNKNFTADKFNKVTKEETIFYTRYISNPKTSSLGLILTDVDRSHIKLHKNGQPFIWQIGSERRTLALAQRAEYFLMNHNLEVYKKLDELENKSSPARNNSKIPAIEAALGLKNYQYFINTLALKEIGYKKISASKNVSRSKSSSTGLFNKIGKYPRSIYAIGSMPPVSGWRDVLVTAAIGHMAVFTNRNNIFAVKPELQINLVKSAIDAIKSFKLDKKRELQVLRNIGAAVGTGNIENEMIHARKLYKAGIRLFRIYTINGDPRVVEIARALRTEFGKEIEIFVGQIVDRSQALKLISEDIAADALLFGHGGGRQCTSATNGMAVTTLEEVYTLITDERFNNTTIMVEGGVGTNVGGLLLMGIDGILYNQQITNGAIETGDLFFEELNGKLCQPYHGSASAPTMIIESANPHLAQNRIFDSGRAMKVEGKPGYTYFSEKVNSMAYNIDSFKHYAARTLADIGAEDIYELREFVKNYNESLIRIVSTEAKSTGEAYLNTK